MVQLSRIGFGGLTVSGVWGETEDSTSIRTIHKAIEMGVNWIDTSPIYGLGHSETIVGEAIKNKREKVLVATKCGLFMGKAKKAERSLNPDFIFKEIDESLKRLGISEIDLYQCHWPDPATPVEDTWEAMAKLVKLGKVKEVGVCNFGIDLLKRIHPIHPVYSLQIPYNLLRRENEKELIPFCNENKIKVLAYSPLHLGLLSGKHDIPNMPENDRRKESAEWTSKEHLRTFNSHFKGMKSLASSKKISMAQLALAWILHNPSIASIIAGMRTNEQVLQNLESLEVTLTSEEMNQLDFYKDESLVA